MWRRFDTGSPVTHCLLAGGLTVLVGQDAIGPVQFVAPRDLFVQPRGVLFVRTPVADAVGVQQARECRVLYVDESADVGNKVGRGPLGEGVPERDVVVASEVGENGVPPRPENRGQDAEDSPS